MEARQVYVFLMRRAQDGQAWPAVYETRELAEKALGRTTAIAELCFDEDGNVLDLLLDAARQAAARAEGERDQAYSQVAKLQEQLGAQMGHEQNISAKWQRLIEDVNQELRLRTKAKVSSACSCPIGTCLEWGGTKQEGACWFQWAEGHILKRAGELRVDFLRQMANHPARIAAIASGDGDKPLNPGG